MSVKLILPFLCLSLVWQACAAVRYVALSSPAPAAPYTNWTTAATNIQDAVDAAMAGDSILVSNGVYATGGRVLYGSLTNRLAVTKQLIVQSVNGPGQTRVEGARVPGTTNGDSAVRCVYLTNGAVLSGFTLALGATRSAGDTVREASGGGILCESKAAVVSNCWIVGNASGYGGGGAFSGTLRSCILSNNTVLQGRAWGGAVWNSALAGCLLISNTAYIGGGACEGELNDCVLLGNSASYGGGAFASTLNGCTVVNNTGSRDGGGVSGGTAEAFAKNSIIYYNSAPVGENWAGGNFADCCTYPLPAAAGNISNSPQFVDVTRGDLHLSSNSICINAGINGFVTSDRDFEGNPRISGGTVDLGAYEYRDPASTISYAWLHQYGVPTDGSADFLDPDRDGMNNWQEWIAGTNPTNAADVLRMLSVASGGNTPGVAVTWQSVNNRTYFLERATNLGMHPAFSRVQSNILGLLGQAGVSRFADTNATGAGPFFYRVGVQ